MNRNNLLEDLHISTMSNNGHFNLPFFAIYKSLNYNYHNLLCKKYKKMNIVIQGMIWIPKIIFDYVKRSVVNT